jgi:exosome complex exonuclease DIS3/RRP44
MDAVEAADFGKDIIVLQTVLEEVRHRSMPLYNRVLALIGDEARRFFVFSNEARQCVGIASLLCDF